MAKQFGPIERWFGPVSVRHGDRYFTTMLTEQQTNRLDNGALISCGLTVGVDLSPDQFKALRRAGQLEEITHDVYKHSGCQSSCTTRGDETCRW